jgi:hypothetical protein
MKRTHLLASTGIKGHYDLVHKRDVKLPGEVENALRTTSRTVSSMHINIDDGAYLHDGGNEGFCGSGVGVVVVDDVRMRCLEIELGWAEGQIRPDRPYISAQL